MKALPAPIFNDPGREHVDSAAGPNQSQLRAS